MEERKGTFSGRKSKILIPCFKCKLNVIQLKLSQKINNTVSQRSPFPKCKHGLCPSPQSLLPSVPTIPQILRKVNAKFAGPVFTKTSEKAILKFRPIFNSLRVWHVYGGFVNKVSSKYRCKL